MMDWQRYSNPVQFGSEARLLSKFFVDWDMGGWVRDERTIRILQERFPFNGEAYRTGKYSRFGAAGGPYSFSKSIDGLKKFMRGIALRGGPPIPVFKGQIRNGIDTEEAARWYLAAMQRGEVPKTPKRHMEHLIEFREVLSTKKVSLKKAGSYRRRARD